ncbi:hypothetical protein E2C01_051844 [Portunus trituberculatus]|uniref:Uncharacterized protein n=1 Tax=Portunus trituberculatus TaxID=210409 RepID=A0A5B7GKF6_PORTR|nr:hypothetical protein [Portunus trituberculatus]
MESNTVQTAARTPHIHPSRCWKLDCPFVVEPTLTSSKKPGGYLSDTWNDERSPGTDHVTARQDLIGHNTMGRRLEPAPLARLREVTFEISLAILSVGGGRARILPPPRLKEASR